MSYLIEGDIVIKSVEMELYAEATAKADALAVASGGC